MTQTFKVGDRVRFIGPFFKGAEGTVLDSSQIYNWRVRRDGWTHDTLVNSHEIELIEKKETPMTQTFKVGDKVKLNPTFDWYAPDNVKAKREGAVGEVAQVYQSGVLNRDGLMIDILWPYGRRTYSNPASQLILVNEATPSSEPLKETLAEVDAKLRKAVADQADAQKAIRDAEAVKALQDQAIARAKKRDAEANERIIAFGDQIVKLKELEKGKLRVGAVVQVKDGNFRFQLQVGTVLEVGESNWVQVKGGFYDTDGYRSPDVIFAKEELEVIR